MAPTVFVLGLLGLNAFAATAQPTTPPPLPARLVAAFDTMFAGEHAGLRAVHANGVVLEGRFLPAPSAATLSRAAHLNGGPVPIVARFSNFAGSPNAADGSPDSSPRGMAIRFRLPDDVDTDIVAHSYNGFPAATPEAFLAFLQAVPKPSELQALASSQPAVRDFLNAPKPTPESYATEVFFGVNAFRFVNIKGEQRAGRYRMVPLAGERHLNPQTASSMAPDFLARELVDRLHLGPIRFRLEVQLALEGDQTRDGSRPWPDDRPTVELGTLEMSSMAVDQRGRQRALRFVPTSLVDGILPSDDPMLLARTQAYRVSAERRGGSN